jgi:hypothetical protein
MKIRTIWGQRADDGMMPELIDAWDEYTEEENPEDFDEALEKAKARTEFVDIRIIVMVVPDRTILDAFKVPVVAVTVESPDEG